MAHMVQKELQKFDQVMSSLTILSLIFKRYFHLVHDEHSHSNTIL